MDNQLLLRCQCGQVRGAATGLSRASSTRIICMCDDCQAFARYLGRTDILDEHGGSDILQLSSAQVALNAGADQLRCMRLSPKGMMRWYTACCRSPVGNTLASAKVPFVGMLHSFIDQAADARNTDELLGPPVKVLARFASGGPPAGAHLGVPPRVIARAVRLLLWWSLTRRGLPSPFFEKNTGRPVSEPLVLSKEERDGLRSASQ
jgi:hypothetical protein